MPSGPKKRRAAKRKNEEKAKAKQTDDLTTVSVVKLTIPIEKLAKGAVCLEATSVDKKLDKTKKVSDGFKAHAKQTDVYVKLAKVADLHEDKSTIEEVSDNSNAIQENNEVPLLDGTSNEVILVSNDEQVLSKNDGCFMEIVESGEILLGDESCGVETEQLTSAPEQMFEMLSDDMMPEKMLERYHDLFSDNDISTLDYDKDRGFFFRDVPVGAPGEPTAGEIVAANEVATVVKGFEESKLAIGEVHLLKDVSVVENVIEANEESLLNVTTNEDKEMSKEANEESLNSSCIVESVDSVVVPELKEDTAPLDSVNVMSNESIKKAENASMIHNQSTEVVEGMKDAAQLVSDKGTLFILPKVGLPVVLDQPSSNDLLKENAAGDEKVGCFSAHISSDSKEMQALSTGTVSPATENEATEMPSDSNVMQAVPEGTVPPATVNQVYFACPMHCKSECSFSQLLRGELMENVVELKSVIHSLKEDLEKALNKLDSISY